MPPRARRGQTDEEKQEALKKWKEGDECKELEIFISKIDAEEEGKTMENSKEDLSGNWTEILEQWYKVMETLKIPKKAKKYE